MVENQKSRLKYVDFFRGIGIIMMVMAHVGFGGYDHFVHAFHMPMFFFVSGYFFSYKRGVKIFPDLQSEEAVDSVCIIYRRLLYYMESIL